MERILPDVLRARLVALPSLLQIFATTAALSLGVQLAAARPALAEGRTGKASARTAQSATAAASRAIRREGDLAPRQDRAIEATLGTSTDVKPAAELRAAPSLSAGEMDEEQKEHLVDEKLDEEIDLAERLLQIEQSCSEAAPIRFRLADMYWEKSKRAFFKTNDSSLQSAQKAKYEKRMAEFQQAAIQTFEMLTWQCPNYPDYPKVLYQLGRCLVEANQGKRALSYFNRIINENAPMEWVANAWFMIGEEYFNHQNNAQKALRAYQKAAQFPRSPVFAFALYKQAWCHVNTGEWKTAAQRFLQALKAVEDREQPLDDRLRGALRKETLRDFVQAYSHVGTAEQAHATFSSLSDEATAREMLERLGALYIHQGAHHDVITTFRDLTIGDPGGTRAAVFQGYILDASSRLGDLKAMAHEIELLSQYLQRARKVVVDGDVADERLPALAKDLRDAEQIAENTLRRIAIEQHAAGRKLHGEARRRVFTQAVGLYRAYLELFPVPPAKAEVNFPMFMRFYYAEALYSIDELEAAAAAYDGVLDMRPNLNDKRERQIALTSAEEAVRAYNDLARDNERANPPKIEGTSEKPIPEIQQKLIRACQRYIEQVGNAGERIVEIYYKMGRIYYTYNHFNEAAPVFHQIVEKYPDSAVACYAANLALDIYNGLGDYKALRETSRAYANSPRLACGKQERTKFAQIEVQSAFHLIKSELEDKKQFVNAGNSYLSFYKDYPQSDLADDAVFNAALNFERANRLEKADEVRRFLVERLPDSRLAADTLFDMAKSHERVFDLAEAAKSLEAFAERYSKDERARDALYNAAIYRQALGNFEIANEDRARYVRLYSQDKDAPKVALAACEASEEQARLLQSVPEERPTDSRVAAARSWKQAEQCYASWVGNSAFAKSDPDMNCHALSRHSEIMRTKTGAASAAIAERRDLLAAWPKLLRKFGAERLTRCVRDVAELAFHDLQDASEHYTTLRIAELDPNKKSAFDASVRAKTEARDRLVAAYRDIVALGEVEWGLAALFAIGELYNDSITKLLEAPIPDYVGDYEVSVEDKEILRQQLREMAAPSEASAVEAYALCRQKGHEFGVYSKWSSLADARLAALRPDLLAPLEEKVVALLVPRSGVRSGSSDSSAFVLREGDSFKPLDLRMATRDPAESSAATPSDGTATTGSTARGGDDVDSSSLGFDLAIALPIEDRP